jgi:hypothetical protein
MIDAVFLLVPISLTAFLLRITWKRTIVSGADAFYHLLSADEIKKYGRGSNPGKYFVGDQSNTYPLFFASLLSILLRFLSAKFLLRYLAPLLDCFNLIIFYALLSSIFSQSIALIASFFYAVTPISVSNSFSLSPRQLAVFLFTSCILSLWIAYTGYNLLFFVLSAFSFSLLLMTHKSSSQAILGLLLILSLSYLFWDIMFSLYVAAVFLIGVSIN